MASVVLNSHTDLLSEIEEKFKLFKYILSNSELTTELCRKSRHTKEDSITNKETNKKKNRSDITSHIFQGGNLHRFSPSKLLK